MSKVLGVITEYNPFHNGHLYHLKKAKELTNADFVVCVMSGNFVQRGETSLVDKWTKTRMALENGIDLVIELPTLYAISSAENFAYGAVSILHSLGIVDNICFGSECGNIHDLQIISDILVDEPKKYKEYLSLELEQGLSYPKARENALSLYFKSTNINIPTEIISSPNNILGIEYLKALKKLNSSIIPVTIQRNKVQYEEKTIVDNIASATGIRQMIKDNSIDMVKKVVPKNVYSILTKSNLVPDIFSFEKEIVYALRKLSIKDIKNLPDVSEGLENKIKNSVNKTNNLNILIEEIKSKRYTRSRIQRILLYGLLGITKKDILDSTKIIPYARVLGMTKEGKKLLSKISGNTKLITSIKKFVEDENNSDLLKDMLAKDILSTNIYTLSYSKNSVGNLDYTEKIIEI